MTALITVFAVNPILHAGAETAQLGWLMGLTTLSFLTTMIGWTLWAYAPSRREAMRAHARIPFDGGDA